MALPVNNRNELLQFNRSYAFVIGINDYPLLNAHLVSAVSDAREIARILKYRQGFDEVRLFLGIDGNASEAHRAQLAEGLDDVEITYSATGATIRQLLEEVRSLRSTVVDNSNDCVVFYFAGHGKAGTFDQSPQGYLFPSDARPKNALLENDSLILMGDLYAALREMDCHHTLLILDCCFAGKFRFAEQQTRDVEVTFFMPMYEERFERFKRERAWQVLVSAGPSQTAADWLGERSENGKVHSPFAQALIQALEGSAEIKPPGRNLGDGVLTSQELWIYLWDKVEKWTKESGFHIQYPDIFPMGDHGGGQFIFFDPNNKKNLPNYTPRNPYMGLRAFEPEDHDLFFGRQSVIDDLLIKLAPTSIFLLTGPSGIGKSSLVKAGIFPQMKDRPDHWSPTEMIVLRPGVQPFQRFEALEAQLDPSQPQLLLIDQYEELFTECEDPVERAKFEEVLIDLLNRAKAGAMKIVLTMRSDFEWQLEASDFGRAFWDRDNLYSFMYRVPPMSLDELRAALVTPAWVEAYDFESDNLVDFILEEVSYAPGALPMLSFTMSELYWLTRGIRDNNTSNASGALEENDRLFTLEKYKEELKGVNGALSKRAGEVYAGLPDQAHRDIMKNILLRMVRLNDGSYTGRQVWLQQPGGKELNELAFPNDPNGLIVEEVLDRLASAFLIIRGGESGNWQFIEPAHDALINFWPRCRQWIEDLGRETLMLQRNLWQSVLDHHSEGTALIAPDDRRSDLVPEKADLATRLSHTWEFNPKLEELSKNILDPSGKWLNYKYVKFLDTFAPLIWDVPLTSNQQNMLHSLEPPQVQRNTLTTLLRTVRPVAEREGPETRSGHNRSGNSSNRPAGTRTGRTSERFDDLNELIRAQMSNWLNVAERAFVKISWERRQGRIEQLTRERNRALSNLFAFRAKQEADVTIAFRMAEFAIRIDAQNPQAMEQLIERYYFSDHPFHQTLVGPAGEVHDLSFSPDGTMIASAADSKVWLWEVATGRELATLPSGDTKRLCFTPNGTQLITAGNDGNGSIRFWDVAARMELTDLAIPDAHNGKRIEDMDLSSDGKLLVTITAGGNEDPEAFVVKLWDISTQALVRSWDVAQAEIRNRWARNGRERLPGVIYATDENYVGHQSHPRFIRFNGNGTMVITSEARNSNFLVWEVATARPLFKLTGQGGATNLHDVYRDGRFLLTVAHDNTIRKWDLTTGEEVVQARLTEYRDAYFNALALHPNQREAAVAMDTGFNHYDLNHRDKIIEFRARAHEGSVDRIDYASDGRRIATASYRIIRIWDRKANEWKKKTFNQMRITENTDRNSEINMVCWHPGGSHFISAARDNTLKKWELGSDQPRLLAKTRDDLKTACYHPSGSQILLAWGVHVQIFDPLTTFNTAPDYSHDAPVNSAIYSPDGQLVLSGDENGGIRLWHSGLQTFLLSEQGHDHAVTAIAFPAAHSKRFATADSANNMKVWTHDQELDTWQVIAFRGELFGINHLAFSADGNRLIAAGGGRFRLFEIGDKSATERMVCIHENVVSQAFYAFNETRIISLGINGKIKVWEAETGDLLYRIDHTDRLNAPRWAQMHPQKAQLLVATNVDAVFYQMDPWALIREAEDNINMSALTREQIEKFRLEDYLTHANLQDEVADLQPLIRTGDEALLYNFAEYFEFKGFQRDNPQVRRSYHHKALLLFEEAAKIATLHTRSGYEERIAKYRNSWLRP